VAGVDVIERSLELTSTIRQVLVTAAVATVCTVTVVLAMQGTQRPPIIIGTPAATSTNGSTFNPGVITSGDATVSKRPDVAFISTGVESQAPTAAAAQRDLATQAGRLIAKAKSLGLTDKDINTSSYSIGPNYTPDGAINGYRAGEELSFKWHNVDTTGGVLDALVQAGGATRISVSFGLNDPKAAEAEARALAIADARARGSAMASAAGVTLGSVLRVSDYTSGLRTPTADFAPSAAAAPTQVPVGTLDISVSVEVDFAIA
jgi:uncharacterized protein YggE